MLHNLHTIIQKLTPEKVKQLKYFLAATFTILPWHLQTLYIRALQYIDI